jgi:hypothetical protein
MPERLNEGGGGEGVSHPESMSQLMLRLRDLDLSSPEAQLIITKLNERARSFRGEPSPSPNAEEKDDRPWWAKQNE